MLLQSVKPSSSLSLMTDKLRLLLFHVNANVYDCQRGEAKGCSGGKLRILFFCNNNNKKKKKIDGKDILNGFRL